MGRVVSDGKGIQVVVPISTVITQGNFHLLDGIFGMAVQSVTTDASTTSKVTLNVAQEEYESSQITVADAFAKGDKVYWNNTTKLLTTVANPDASGNPQNRPVGRVTSAKDAGNVIWFLLGPQIQAHA